MAHKFSRWIPALTDADAKVRLDLVSVNRIQMDLAGIPAGRVSSFDNCCTRCNPEQLHSFRRDGERAGRMVSAIRVK